VWWRREQPHFNVGASGETFRLLCYHGVKHITIPADRAHWLRAALVEADDCYLTKEDTVGHKYGINGVRVFNVEIRVT